VGLDLEHLGASLGKDKIVVSGRLGPQDYVANDRGMRGLIEHLAVMFLSSRAEPRKLVYGLTGREQQGETKKQQITGHLLNLRILERFRMPGILLVCPECSRQAPRFKGNERERRERAGTSGNERERAGTVPAPSANRPPAFAKPSARQAVLDSYRSSPPACDPIRRFDRAPGRVKFATPAGSALHRYRSRTKNDDEDEDDCVGR
jgi:hypothetical protein